MRIRILFFLSLGLALSSTPFAFTQTFVQGNVSGRWTKIASPYVVLANVTVPSSDTLTIEPGVSVKFSLGISMAVDGTLMAIGAPSDSIRFTTAEPGPAPGKWGQILFSFASNATLSVMDYVVVEFGGSNTVSAVVESYGNLHMDHALVRYNGSGLSLTGSGETVLANSIIQGNSNYGIIARRMAVFNVQFLSNSGYYGGNAGGQVTFVQCTFRGNSPNAFILFDGSTASNFLSCLIEGNAAGIGSCYQDDTLHVDSCHIINNNGHGINAHALYNRGIVIARHSIIAGNAGAGILEASQGSVIEQNDIVGNGGGIESIVGESDMVIHGNVIAGNSGTGIGLLSGQPPSIRFNDVYGNLPDFSGLSSFVGDTTLAVNRNGVHADLYMNIRRDPMFLNTSDYHLQPNSPCIDAGDTLLSDGDGTVSDIGAFSYVHPTAVINSGIGAPQNFSLMQNYPNPFNPSTTIRYGLPVRSDITLRIFNILGQQVAELVNGSQEAGYHELQFNASGLASGIYVYRLQAGSFVETRTIVLWAHRGTPCAPQ
jgi:hypothetical protein